MSMRVMAAANWPLSPADVALVISQPASHKEKSRQKLILFCLSSVAGVRLNGELHFVLPAASSRSPAVLSCSLTVF